MKILKNIGFAAILVAGSAQAGNADLVVTQVANGSSTQFQFDMLNDAGATAFQFEMKIEGAEGMKMESSNCLSGLPSTHTGACNLSNGMLKVAVISTSNAVLTSGSIGSITISAPASSLKASVGGLLVGTPDGAAVNADAILDGFTAKENFEK
ncbi:MAG: hypothetical protein AB8B96_03440 [Lysobacterales bacterium]